MTIKTSGSLSLGEIQAEFGGSNPIGLTEYLAGRTYVNSGVIGYPNGVATPIPSSPPIRISNFYGASAEPSTVDIANYFWTNRTQLIRYSNLHYYPVFRPLPGASGNTGYYTNVAGYEYFWWNNPNARYSFPSITNNWTHGPSSLFYTHSGRSSIFYSVLTCAAGQINNYPSLTSSASPGRLIWDSGTYAYVGDGAQPSLVGDGYGISINMKVYEGQVKDVTSSTCTTSTAGGNAGTWTYQYIIPGKWTWDGLINFPFTYETTIAPGEMVLTLLERGGNGRGEIPPPYWPYTELRTSLVSTGIDQWWYNGADALLSVNTTSSTQNFGWQNGEENYFYGNHTPRGVFKLLRWY